MRLVGAGFRRIATGMARSADYLRTRWAAFLFAEFVPSQGARLAKGCRVRPTDGGCIKLGAHVHVDCGSALIAKKGEMTIGSDTYVGRGCVIVATDGIEIGSDCLIGEYVTIRDQDHEFEVSLPYRMAGMRSAPICIGNNVWVGAKATVTRGVSIGDNAVIGANSVVTENIPSNAIVAGCPARVIRLIERTDDPVRRVT